MPEQEFPVGEELGEEFWLDEPDQFPGRVDSVTVRPMSIGDELQDRIVVEIKNLLHDAMVLGFFSPSKHPNSKWRRWCKVLVELGVDDIKQTADIVGRYFVFERQDWSFGGDFIARGVPAPIEVLNSAEEAEERAELMAAEMGIDRTAADEAEAKLTAEEEYLLNLVCGAIDGEDYDGFLQKVVAIPDIVTNPEYMAPLVDPRHTYINDLVALGALTIDEDGTYHAVFDE